MRLFPRRVNIARRRGRDDVRVFGSSNSAVSSSNWPSRATERPTVSSSRFPCAARGGFEPRRTNTNARKQLGKRERLDQVIVGSAISPRTRSSIASRGEHEHRRFSPCARSVLKFRDRYGREASSRIRVSLRLRQVEALLAGVRQRDSVGSACKPSCKPDPISVVSITSIRTRQPLVVVFESAALCPGFPERILKLPAREIQAFTINGRLAAI